MLELENISASYGAVRALESVSLSVAAGQVVCLLGANGAGKTTTLNCISGVVPLAGGRIRFEGEDVSGLSIDRIVARGIVQVPEGREIFPELSVARQSARSAPGCTGASRARTRSSGSTTISRA